MLADELIKTILSSYPLKFSGVHGPAHWARVLENGLHLAGLTGADLTVQTCWDADRLDLGRVWIIPEKDKLCTEPARDPKLIAWATERAKSHYRPVFLDQWLEDF